MAVLVVITKASYSIDLNADLGEGGPSDSPLLDVVSSASIACGFHAGNPLLMLETARMASARGVVVGAHPSYDDRQGFGRREMDIPREELVALLVYQIGAMAAAAAAAGTRLRFVKPHGALYNRAAVDSAVAEAVAESLLLTHSSLLGGLVLLCPAGSALAAQASLAGVPVFAEVFADRAYAPDGTLVSRSVPGSLLDDPEAAARRAIDLVLHRRVVARDGSVLEMHAESLCVHGDTPGALSLARAVRSALEEAGVTIAAFAQG